MTLSDRSINDLVESGELKVEPFLKEALQPASIDVRLGSILRVPVRQSVINPRVKQPMEEESIPAQGSSVRKPYRLKAGGFVLGHTIEWVELPDYIVGRIEGKSSIGRLGLTVHSTAGYIDPGFRGQLTLEIKNNAEDAILLSAGLFIAQLSFMYTTTPVKRPYGSLELKSKYQDQEGPVESRMYQDY